jgi:hypothetical protein
MFAVTISQGALLPNIPHTDHNLLWDSKVISLAKYIMGDFL